MPNPRTRTRFRGPLGVLAAATVLAGCSSVPTTAGVPLDAATPATARPEGASGQASPLASRPPALLAPSSSPTPTPVPTPTPTPPPARYHEDFERMAVGSQPADWVDVTTEETTPAWVYPGNWKVGADDVGNHVFLHDDIQTQPAVSFRRYRGTALGGANGHLPDVYFAETTERPIKSPNNYPPTGDQGVQFYYLQFDRYLEVVIKPDQIEIWECNGGVPHSSKGWTRLWNQALATNAGDKRRVGALVDIPHGTFTAYLDGQALGTVQSALLQPGAHAITLRGIGNVVSFDDITIEPR